MDFLRLLFKNKTFKTSFIFFIVIISALFFLDILTKGTIYIHTDKKTLVKIKPVNSTEILYEGAGKYSFHNRTGKYLVEASRYEREYQKIVEIKPLTTIRLSVDLLKNNIIGLEPLTPGTTTSMFYDRNMVRYFNTQNNNVVFIDQDQKVSNVLVPNNSNTTDINYTKNGDVILTDNKNIYKINSGEVIRLPQPKKNYIDSSSRVSVYGNDIYITNGKSIYKTSDFGNSYQLIFSSKKLITKIYPHKNNLLILTSLDNKSNDDVGLLNSTLLMLDKNGKPIKSINVVGFSDAVWSSSGKYISVLANNSYIYNMELSNEKDIPSQNIATLGWVDDRSFIYTDGRNIFKYNIDELKSDFLYKTASNEIVEYLYVKNNKIYISINLGDGIGYISRLIINDKNQYQKINNVLPYATKHCYFTYNNFNKPTIIINNSNNSCIEDLKVNLKSNNIDIGKYIVKYDPSS